MLIEVWFMIVSFNLRYITTGSIQQMKYIQRNIICDVWNLQRKTIIIHHRFLLFWIMFALGSLSYNGGNSIGRWKIMLKCWPERREKHQWYETGKQRSILFCILQGHLSLPPPLVWINNVTPSYINKLCQTYIFRKYNLIFTCSKKNS